MPPMHMMLLGQMPVHTLRAHVQVSARARALLYEIVLEIRRCACCISISSAHDVLENGGPVSGMGKLFTLTATVQNSCHVQWDPSCSKPR